MAATNRSTSSNLTMILISVLFALCTISVSGQDSRTIMDADITSVMTPDENDYDLIGLQMLERQYFTFSVKACHNAHIYLLNTYREFNNGTEIRIGDQDNKRSRILANPGTPGATELASASTPNVLDCVSHNEFWLSWRSGVLWVGRGSLFGHQLFLSFNRTLHPNTSHPINVLRLGSGFGATAAWRFRENLAGNVNFTVPYSLGYRHLFKTVFYKNGFYTFLVRGERDAQITLSQTPEEAPSNAYFIEIGGFRNARSSIRRDRTGRPVDEYLKPGLLSPLELRPFWVSWKDGTIKVGRGYVYDNNTFLSWTDPWPRQVNSIAFSTQLGNIVEWMLEDDLEPRYYFETRPASGATAPATLYPWISIPRQTYIRFSVMSCEGATLTLSPTDSPTQGAFSDLAVELIIGAEGNTKTKVKRPGEPNSIVERNTPGILRCGRMTSFWVEWATSTVKFGRDTLVGVDTIIEWGATSPEFVNTILFTSTATVSTWRVDQNMGDRTYMITSENTNADEAWISVRQEQFKSFSLMGCKASRVLLSAEDGVITNQTYEVVIGHNNNQFTIIRQAGLNGTIAQSASTPDVLSCDEARWFWVGWSGSVISVGRGWRFGQGTIVQAEELFVHAVAALNIGNDESTVQWGWEADNGDKVMLNTTGNVANVQWLSLVKSRTWVSLSVRACQQLNIFLATDYGRPQTGYKIILEEKDGNHHIKKGFGNTDSVALVKSTGVLSCEDPRDFWIRWLSGEVEIGLGRVPGNHRLLGFVDNKPLRVMAIGMASDGGNMAEWRLLENDYTESKHVMQPNIGLTQSWFTLRHRQSVRLAVLTCPGVQVALSSMVGVTSPGQSMVITLDTKQGSEIRDGLEGELLTRTVTPLLFSCNVEQYLWISWYRENLLIGSGTRFGENVIFNINRGTNSPIRAFGFRSTSDLQARVRVLHATGDEFGIIRPPTGQRRPKPSGLSGGAVAGIVIGVLLGVGVLVALAAAVYTRRDKVEDLVHRVKAKAQGETNAPRSFENPNIRPS